MVLVTTATISQVLRASEGETLRQERNSLGIQSENTVDRGVFGFLQASDNQNEAEATLNVHQKTRTSHIIPITMDDSQII